MAQLKEKPPRGFKNFLVHFHFLFYIRRTAVPGRKMSDRCRDYLGDNPSGSHPFLLAGQFFPPWIYHIQSSSENM
jgi:hypothetical protein